MSMVSVHICNNIVRLHKILAVHSMDRCEHAFSSLDVSDGVSVNMPLTNVSLLMECMLESWRPPGRLQGRVWGEGEGGAPPEKKHRSNSNSIDWCQVIYTDKAN
jgi:hypothetical protein